MIRRSLKILGIAALAVLFAYPASATTKPDIVAGLGTLPLLINKINGDIKMAVIYDPAIPSSKADADAIVSIVAGGVDVPGGGKLSVLLVSVDELSKLSRVKLAFITPGLSAHFPDITVASSAASILTMSTDIECVKAAACIVGVATNSNVTIYFSKPAAEAAKIEFSQAFAMLVREL